MFGLVNLKLRAIAEQHGGVFSYEEAVGCGYSLNQVRDRVRAGRWRRLCRGQYTAVRPDPDAPAWRQAVTDHRLAMRAAVRSLNSPVVLSHQSAVVAYELPTWGLDLSRVHVTRCDRASGRIIANVVQHRAILPAGAIWHRDGLDLVAPARAIVEIACTAGFEAGLVVADAALRERVVRKDVLEFAVCDAENWPGSPAAKQLLEFCDPRSGSVGETRLRLLMERQGLPKPELQAPMLRGGEPFAFVDFFFGWPYNTVVEFDGLQKYGGNTAQVVIQEKWREDAIRELGHQFVRVIWEDLAYPARTAARLRAAFARAAAARKAS